MLRTRPIQLLCTTAHLPLHDAFGKSISDMRYVLFYARRAFTYFCGVVIPQRTAQDLCVGDFWETKERRAAADFTTVIGVDRFLLVSMAEREDTSAVLQFLSSFDVARSII